MNEIQLAIKELAKKCKDEGLNYVFVVESKKTGIFDSFGCSTASRIYELIKVLKKLTK